MTGFEFGGYGSQTVSHFYKTGFITRLYIHDRIRVTVKGSLLQFIEILIQMYSRTCRDVACDEVTGMLQGRRVPLVRVLPRNPHCLITGE